MKTFMLFLALFSTFAQAAYVPYPVTSGSDKQRIESAIIGSGSVGSVGSCSGSPCTVVLQGPTWISSATRASTGLYTVNFTSGVFSTTPRCMVTQARDSAVIPRTTMESTGSSSSIGVTCRDSSNSVADCAFGIHCMGPR